MHHKKRNDKPYILKGLLLGLFSLMFFVVLFSSLSCNALPKICLLLLSIFIAVFFTRTFINWAGKKQTFGNLNQFNPIKALGIYSEANSQFSTNEKKYDHFVLLLHGFSASPNEMQQLIDDMKAKGIPYLAPAMVGFGLTDFHLIRSVKHQDFFRVSLFYYDFLCQIADKVSIVAHSMGAVVGTYIAQQRQVHQLILTAPALYFFPEDKSMIRLLLTPVLSDIVIGLIPCLPKTVKKSTDEPSVKKQIISNRFQYLSVPTHAIKQMLIAKQKVDITKIKDTSLTIIYGEKDKVVNVKTCLEIIEKNMIPHRVISIPNTGHNLFESSTKQQVSETILAFLK